MEHIYVNKVVLHRNALFGTDYSSKYLLEIAKTYPVIEYLNGWKKTYIDNKFVDCDEIFCASKTSQENFLQELYKSKTDQLSCTAIQ